MSKPRIPPKSVVTEIIDNPVETEAEIERRRQFRKSAAGQIGFWMVIDAPLPLLAQYIVELDADDRPEFLRELVARLPADAVQPLIDALRARLDGPAA